MPELGEYKKLKNIIKNQGWLMESDQKLPSVVTEIVGKPVKGSWWGHAKGNLIYNTCGLLEDDIDILCIKLINKKKTYIHRRYWDLLAYHYQTHTKILTKELSKEALKLFRIVEQKKVLSSGDRAKELANHLICFIHSVHTDKGSHATELIGWPVFFKQRKFKPANLQPEEFVDLSLKFKGKYKKYIKFPWD